MVNDHTCLMCNKPADWIRHTQFAGNHPYCTEHANLENDFLAPDDSYQYWSKIVPEGEIQ